LLVSLLQLYPSLLGAESSMHYVELQRRFSAASKTALVLLSTSKTECGLQLDDA
jgi:hypothetical protein